MAGVLKLLFDLSFYDTLTGFYLICVSGHHQRRFAGGGAEALDELGVNVVAHRGDEHVPAARGGA